jgi:hypothetical protein
LINYFGTAGSDGDFNEIFALSDTGRAVAFNYDGQTWRPRTPSRKLGAKVLRDESLHHLTAIEKERLFDFIDPPRNFDAEWRAEQRWAGSDLVSLYLFSVVAIWFFEEQIFGWPRAYTVMLLAGASLSPILLMIWDFKPLERALVRMSVEIDGEGVGSLLDLPSQAASELTMATPAQASLLKSIRNMPEERFQELARMGVKLAQRDAEENLRVRTQEHLERQRMSQTREAKATLQKTASEVGGVWTVYVDDNFHYMDQSDRYVLGSFESYDQAVTACRQIVDRCIASISAKTADELFKSYASFGDDPWIDGPVPEVGQSPFSAWDYARVRASEIHPQN